MQIALLVLQLVSGLIFIGKLLFNNTLFLYFYCLVVFLFFKIFDIEFGIAISF